ncbi:hypothetical protein [Caballeronia sp. AZ1_KS37]|uniref:hypothetical protein n=1 Tax=Caballeronia sp. AZ1_KS37 TaxID=2921756 RepID=UPI002027DE2C|nr:hypothetical protein [Caballeronia sp. AZ1_KS37]
MTTSKDRATFEDGRIAEEQLEVLNPLFAEFRQRAIDAWIAAQTAEERERQWAYVTALESVKHHFTSRVQSARIAAAFPKVDNDGE